MKDLTVGKPGRVLLTYSLPLFGSIIFQQLYNIADSFVAGHFISTEALAAVGNSSEITLIFIGHFQNSRNFTAIFHQCFNLFTYMIFILLKHFKRLSYSGRPYFQLKIFLLTVQFGFNKPAQLYTIFNPHSFSMVYFHYNFIIRTYSYIY